MNIQEYIPQLRRRLRHHGISQALLARTMRLPKQSVNKWLNTWRSPSLRNIQNIELALTTIRLIRRARRASLETR